MACTPKVSQEDLAGRLASRGLLLSQGQIAKLENGQRPIADYELKAIARALRVPIQALFE
jgi:transcriptional regulator with XRE-family HTH domain